PGSDRLARPWREDVEDRPRVVREATHLAEIEAQDGAEIALRTGRFSKRGVPELCKLGEWRLGRRAAKRALGALEQRFPGGIIGTSAGELWQRQQGARHGGRHL